MGSVKLQCTGMFCNVQGAGRAGGDEEKVCRRER